jgi:hypothetical protein
MTAPRYLKNMETGVVFVFSKAIVDQPNMIPYDPEEENEEEAVEEEEPVDLYAGVPFSEYKAEETDGPVFKDVVKLANAKQVTLSKLAKFNPRPADFKAHYASGPIKMAVAELKRRVLPGE